jgi:hypothetical protein
MAKKTVEVDRNKLELAIEKAEVNGPLGNLNLLWEAVTEFYNKSYPPTQITKSVVMLRVNQWGLQVKTKAGKKGRTAGVSLTEEQKLAMKAGRKTSRKEKFANDPVISAGLEQLGKQVPERWSNLVEKLKNGSMKAAVTLNCLDCTAYQPKEIKLCTCTSCPLFAFRPYKGKLGDSSEEIDSELESESEEIDSELENESDDLEFEVV